MGRFAEYVAKSVGANVRALTISQEQFDYARERIHKAGLNDKVEVVFQDYRDENGVFDRIASIEMFEPSVKNTGRPTSANCRSA